MKEIEAISGIFTNNGTILFLQRTADRTYFPNCWDLMGGDIEPGKTPESQLIKDAKEKLNVKDVSVAQAGQVSIIGADALIHRHYFICSGDFSEVIIDSKRYSQYSWKNVQNVKELDLVPGVELILQTAGLLQ